MTQIFDRHMTYNMAKVRTLEQRLKKYIARGYKYYEFSRLYNLNIPQPHTLGHGYTADSEADRLLTRTIDSYYACDKYYYPICSPFLISFGRMMARCKPTLSETMRLNMSSCTTLGFNYGNTTFTRCPDYRKDVYDNALAPTPEDLELAHAIFKLFPRIHISQPYHSHKEDVTECPEDQHE